MILVRSPLRISIGGGGTDQESYYSKHEGYFISAAINQYIYISLLKPFQNTVNIKYSTYEKVKKVDQIKHPIFKEVFKHLKFDDSIEIISLADIPSGTGLGSSGSFTTALLKGLYCYRNNEIDKESLAELACKIEIDLLKSPIGKQDQYIASYGGIKEFEINKKGNVKVSDLGLSNETILNLEENLILFFTGYSRNANSVLKDQVIKSMKDSKEMMKNLHFTKNLAIEIKKQLIKGNVDEFGKLMHEHWLHKIKRSRKISNEKINGLYNGAMKCGALGGKLVGAGGGGFLMFYCENKKKIRQYFKKYNLEEVRFRFDHEGTKILIC